MHGSDNDDIGVSFKTLRFYYYLKIKECDELKEELIRQRRENEQLKAQLRAMEESNGQYCCCLPKH